MQLLDTQKLLGLLKRIIQDFAENKNFLFTEFAVYSNASQALLHHFILCALFLIQTRIEMQSTAFTSLLLKH